MNSTQPSIPASQPVILIGIPTCMRPGMLAICLQSISESTLPENVDVYMVVADNDVNESARAVVEKFTCDAPFPVKYSVCAERGHSNIRNHLFDCAIAVNADYLASTDDDEGPVNAIWLADLCAVIVETSADAAGPVHGKRTLFSKPFQPRGRRIDACSPGCSVCFWK